MQAITHKENPMQDYLEELLDVLNEEYEDDWLTEGMEGEEL
jgi:hypothetical protein